jgi:hypothetical protein
LIHGMKKVFSCVASTPCSRKVSRPARDLTAGLQMSLRIPQEGAGVRRLRVRVAPAWRRLNMFSQGLPTCEGFDRRSPNVPSKHLSGDCVRQLRVRVAPAWRRLNMFSQGLPTCEGFDRRSPMHAMELQIAVLRSRGRNCYSFARKMSFQTQVETPKRRLWVLKWRAM